MTQDRKTTKNSCSKPNAKLRTAAREPVLGGLMQDTIGRSLQAHFDDIANAPVPDKFLVLLAELEAKETSRDK